MKFLAFSVVLLVPLTMASVRYFNQIPQHQLQFRIKQNYINRIVKLYKNKSEPLYASIENDLSQFILPLDDAVEEMLDKRLSAPDNFEIASSDEKPAVSVVKSYDQSLAAFLKSPSQTKVDVKSAIERIPTVATPTPTRTLSLVEPYQTRKQAYESNIKKFNKMESGKVAIADANFTDFEVVKGVRNYDQTISIVNTNNRSLKYCFRRILRNDPAARGYVQLRFTIHPEGYVDRDSIRILKTDIKDRRVLQCVTRAVSRWRNFPQVPYENGEYSITQKYIF